MLLELISQGRSKVSVCADGVLYVRRSQYQTDLCAMSIVGPETAVRALAAECAVAKHALRPPITIMGRRQQVVARWKFGWSARAVQLAPGAVHMVAVGTTRGLGETVVMPADPLESSVDAAIYRILRERFSTPLLPIGSPGQPAWERVLAEQWRTVLGRALRDYRKRRLWTPLEHHPDQDSNPFAGAGLLAVTQAELDALVSNLARTGRLPIPEAAA